MGENLHKEGIEKYYRERLEKIYCNTRKNIPSEIAYPLKNLLLGLEFNLRLYAYSSSDRLRTLINCQKTYYQPNSFAYSLTNLLYWAYLANFLFLLGLGHNLSPYTTYLLKNKNLLLKTVRIIAFKSYCLILYVILYMTLCIT